MTMICMLFVVGMLIRKASDVDTWRFLTGEQKPAAELADAQAALEPATPTAKPAAAGGTTADDTSAGSMRPMGRPKPTPAARPPTRPSPSRRWMKIPRSGQPSRKSFRRSAIRRR